MICEVGRITISFGPVLASVGLVIYGMGESFPEGSNHELPLLGTGYSGSGIVMMVLGLAILAVGVVLYRIGSEPGFDPNAPDRGE